MIASLLALLALAAVPALAAVLPRQTPPTAWVKGAIIAPAAGTAIAPGSNFTFQYDPRADYGVSTFWYHVFLLDEAATITAPAPTPIDVFSTGYYFGRYDYANYPAVPYATNAAPPELTMPNFSVSPGGWAAGMSASNRKMQLVVVEEWGDSNPVGLGRKLGLTMAEIIYNATSTAD